VFFFLTFAQYKRNLKGTRVPVLGSLSASTAYLAVLSAEGVGDSYWEVEGIGGTL